MTTDPDPRVLVCIPTYNERENITPITGRVLASVPDAHILVIDDGSPDGTGALADELAAADERIHVLHRTEKAGLGAAYIAGFTWGIEQGYDVLVEMDADGSHRPEQLPRLLGALDHADLVLGSRWVPGGKTVGWPLYRKAISLGGTVYPRMLLGLKVHDATGGYRAFRRDTLKAIDYTTVLSQGYCFQIEMAWRTAKAGLRIVEVPITFADRELGESKMSGNIVREALLRVTTWGAEYRAQQVKNTLGRGRR